MSVTTKEPHRSLALRPHLGPMRGEDIATLQRAAAKRLTWRGEDHYVVEDDGVLGEKTARSLSRTLYLLGATGTRMERSKVEDGGRLSVGAQRMIRYPGLRSPEQFARAEARLARLIEDRDREIDTGRAPSGLSEAQRATARRIAVDAALLGHRRALAIHYTMGSMRWEGIERGDLALANEFPNYADCSAFVTWCLWNALHVRFELPDIVNGSNWSAGYTGTLLAHGVPVPLARLQPADLILYGVPGTTGKHVAIYIGDGECVSHGSEGGPYKLDYRYRSDIMGARRFI